MLILLHINLEINWYVRCKGFFTSAEFTWQTFCVMLKPTEVSGTVHTSSDCSHREKAKHIFLTPALNFSQTTKANPGCLTNQTDLWSILSPDSCFSLVRQKGPHTWFAGRILDPYSRCARCVPKSVDTNRWLGDLKYSPERTDRNSVTWTLLWRGCVSACYLLPQLTTLWITPPELWWALPLFSPWCLTAAPESWPAPTCQVCGFGLCVCVGVCAPTCRINTQRPLCLPGELKNPSYAIPRGTITAVIFTFIIYNLLCVLVACTCDRWVHHAQSVTGQASNNGNCSVYSLTSCDWQCNDGYCWRSGVG